MAAVAKFRAANFGDVTALCQGISLAFVPLLQKFYPDGFYAYFANPEWVEDKLAKEFVYVCEVDGVITGGMIVLRHPDERNLKLHTIYVDEGFRRHGLGSFMIKWAETFHGQGVIWRLETLKEIEGNVALYEKLGYEKDGPPKITDKGLTIVYYSKRV